MVMNCMMSWGLKIRSRFLLMRVRSLMLVSRLALLGKTAREQTTERENRSIQG